MAAEMCPGVGRGRGAASSLMLSAAAGVDDAFSVVITAQAGIQFCAPIWIPACAGMTGLWGWSCV